MSINKAIISGNLTRDPELRAISSGTSVLSFGVAVNDRRFNQQTNQWEDRPNFIDCVMFGKRADGLSKYLTKGTKVAIEGKLRWSQWEANDGSKRSKVEVVVDELEFLSRGDGSRQQGSQDTGYGRDNSYAREEIPAAPEISVYDEDVPF